MNGFEETDDRKFTIFSGVNFIISIRQIELLRIIKILEQRRSFIIAKKIRRAIYLRDSHEGTKTNFNRKLSKGDIDMYVMSKKEYIKYTQLQRSIDEDAEGYYNGDKR